MAVKGETLFDEQQDHQETRRSHRERELSLIGEVERLKQDSMQQQVLVASLPSLCDEAGLQMREQAKVSALERQNRLVEERHHKNMQEMKQMVSDQESMCDK